MSKCPTPSKRCHELRAEAEKHRVALLRKGGRDLDTYRCKCGSWHVGHSTALLGKRIRRALNHARPKPARRHTR